MDANEAWFRSRAWSVSGNRLGGPPDGKRPVVTSLAREIHQPRSVDEVVRIVRALPPSTPIACVSGGHGSSGSALVAAPDAVVLDLVHLKEITFHEDADGPLVTVGAGVVFRELVEALREQRGALPVGTGPGVGVVGYVVNGGLSGYFSRRLGLLGQRVERMTVVTAAGEVRVLGTADPELAAMVGAGSALGIVVDVTIRVAPASAIREAQQRVFGFDSRERAVRFTRGAVRLMRDAILPDPSVSQEIVVTGGGAIVVTTTFFDSFIGDPARFLAPLEELAASLELPLLAAARWGSWYEAAGALWPIIEGQSGDPLAFLCHAVGTRMAPDDAAIDYVCDVMVGEAPLDEAPLSIIEIRTLGGAAGTGRPIPTGNHHHDFFVDIVTMYDAGPKDGAARQAILDRTNGIVDRARTIPGLDVDFSGTHSQPDDPGEPPAAELIFGTPEAAAGIRALKKQLDPADRFRFHPYVRILD